MPAAHAWRRHAACCFLTTVRLTSADPRRFPPPGRTGTSRREPGLSRRGAPGSSVAGHGPVPPRGTAHPAAGTGQFRRGGRATRPGGQCITVLTGRRPGRPPDRTDSWAGAAGSAPRGYSQAAPFYCPLTFPDAAARLAGVALPISPWVALLPCPGWPSRPCPGWRCRPCPGWRCPAAPGDAVSKPGAAPPGAWLIGCGGAR